MTIALLPGSHELHLVFNTLLTEFDLGRTEIAEHGQMGFLAHHPLQFLSHGDTTPHNHHVDIIRWALEEDITDISSHHVALQPQMVCSLTDLVENVLIQYLCQLFVRVQFHSLAIFETAKIVKIGEKPKLFMT